MEQSSPCTTDTDGAGVGTYPRDSAQMCSAFATHPWKSGFQFASEKRGPEYSLKPLHSPEILSAKWHRCQWQGRAVRAGGHSCNGIPLSWSPACVCLETWGAQGKSRVAFLIKVSTSSLSDPASSQITGGMEQVGYGGSFLEKKVEELHCTACSWPAQLQLAGCNARACTQRMGSAACGSHTGCNCSSTAVVYSQIWQGCFQRPPASFHPSSFVTKRLVEQIEVWLLWVAVSSEKRDLRAAHWARGHPESPWTSLLAGLHRSGKEEGGEQLTAVSATACVVPPHFGLLNWTGKGSKELLFKLSLPMTRQVCLDDSYIYVFFMSEYRICLFHAQGHLGTLLQKAVMQKLGNPRNRVVVPL